MPGWNHYPVSERLSQHFGVPALVDNDVNIMAVGEHWVNWRDEAFLLFVKIGTGIGSGIVAGGHVHRGADGAAGDIGHIHVRDHDDVVCRCGNVGCLEAVAGGRALANRLHELGLPTSSSRDVVQQVLAGQHDAVRLVRQAGLEIGGVLAACVNILNPAVIVIGGDIAAAGEPLLAGIREVVYRRSHAAGHRSAADRARRPRRLRRHRRRGGDGARGDPRPRRHRRHPRSRQRPLTGHGTRETPAARTRTRRTEPCARRVSGTPCAWSWFAMVRPMPGSPA